MSVQKIYVNLFLVNFCCSSACNEVPVCAILVKEYDGRQFCTVIWKFQYVLYLTMTKDCLFGHQTRFGNLSDQYVIVGIGILTHDTPVHTGVLTKKKKEGEEEGAVEEYRKKKKEEGRGEEAVPVYLGSSGEVVVAKWKWKWKRQW